MADLYWDPYDEDIERDPYDTWRRLRDEAPVYRNDKLDFYANNPSELKGFEGRRYLGSYDVMNNASGDAFFDTGTECQDPVRHSAAQQTDDE